MVDGWSVIEAARAGAGIPPVQLWLTYIAIGGGVALEELEAMLAGRHCITSVEYDLLAHALNEHFMDMGRERVVPYSEELDTWDGLP